MAYKQTTNTILKTKVRVLHGIFSAVNAKTKTATMQCKQMTLYNCHGYTKAVLPIVEYKVCIL